MNKKPLDLIELGLILAIIVVGFTLLLGCAEVPRTYTKSELLRGLDNGPTNQ